MKIKTFLTISIVLIYVIIIALVVKAIKEDTGCYKHNSACFRFCSDDTDEYSDKDLLQEFNKSKSARGLNYDNIIVYRGYPLCGGMVFSYPNDNITSENLPYKFYYGRTYVEEEDFDFRRYCLEKSEYAIDGWNLMICNHDKQIHKIFHIIAISISIILFGLTLFAYIYFKELQDFYGKCVIPLIANQILTYILRTCVDLYDFKYDNEFGKILYIILELSVMHTLLWITVMIVRSMFTFINFKNRTTTSVNISTYAAFVFAFIVLSAITLFTSSFRYGYTYLYTAYFIISILNVIFVIVTGFYVLVLSRDTVYSTKASFHYARKWFWISVKLSLIFLVTWLGKYVTAHSQFKFLLYITVDSMMLLTAVAITILLLGRKTAKILIFEKYRGIKNEEKEIM